MFFESSLGVRRNGCGIKDSLVRGFGAVVVFEDASADAFFGLEFCGRDEEVVIKAPLIFVEVVKEGYDLWVFESAVT